MMVNINEVQVTFKSDEITSFVRERAVKEVEEYLIDNQVRNRIRPGTPSHVSQTLQETVVTVPLVFQYDPHPPEKPMQLRNILQQLQVLKIFITEEGKISGQVSGGMAMSAAEMIENTLVQYWPHREKKAQE